MADTETATSPAPDAIARKKREARRAARDLGLGALVVAAVLVVYARHVATMRVVHKYEKRAHDALLRDTPKGYREAARELQKALRLAPSDDYGVAAMALVSTIRWSELGDADARPVAEKYLQKARAAHLPLAERYAAQGLDLIARGKTGEADTWLQGVLRKTGGVPGIIDAWGRALRAEGKVGAAREAFKKAQAGDWRNPRYMADYADSFLDDGDAQNALSFFGRALHDNPDHLRSIVGVAFCDFIIGQQQDQALKNLADILSRPAEELAPRIKSHALAARALLEDSTGNVKAARADAQAAVVADKDDATAWRIVGKMLAEQRQKMAVQAIETSVRLDPYIPVTYYAAGVWLANAGFTDAALHVMDEYASHLPDSARYHVAYGKLLAKKGDDAGAKKQYQLALKLDPVNADAFFAQGELCESERDDACAFNNYKSALQARDDFPEAYRALGNLYLAKRQLQDALEQYTEALTRFKAEKIAPRKLAAFLDDVRYRVSRAGKRKLAKEWYQEAKALK